MVIRARQWRSMPCVSERLTLVLLCATGFFSNVLAQPTVEFDHLSVKQGLSQSAVMCIFQDSQGFMWFGTQDGLNRYDGYKFTVFKHDPTNPRSLSYNLILSIHEGPKGTLWIGTADNPKVVNRFDRLTESFTQWPSDSVDLNNALGSSVQATYIDSYGTRWFGSIGGGLTRVETETGNKTTYKHDPSNPKSLIDNRVYYVYGDRTGTIWVGTREGLDRFDRQTETFIHYRHDDSDPNSLSDNWVWPIYEDRDGILWVGTKHGGLNRLDRTRGTFAHYRYSSSDPRSLSDDDVLSIYQDRSGVLWVGTSDNGLNRFHPGLGAFMHFANDPLDPGSLIDNTIKSICVDRSGVAWIGTTRGLDRFDRANEAFTHYKHDASNSKSLGDNIPQYIYEDRSGTLWIGTYSSGLDRFDRKTGVFVHYRHDASDPKTLSDNRVYALCEDQVGEFWVGTYGGGLNRLDRKTGTFTTYTHNDSVPTSLSANGVWSLYEDHEGVLWVGTSGGGLNRFNRDTGTFTHYRHDDSNPASLSDDNIICIHEDRAGTLWLGTIGGLNRFNRETGKFKHFREKDGLPNDFVFGILEDNLGLPAQTWLGPAAVPTGRQGQAGNLWLSTNKGLSRFDPEQETFRNYDYYDGLQSDEFNQDAFATDRRTGEMYFGGVNGFNLFHPDSVKENPYVSPVVFSSCVRYNTDDEQGRPIEEKGISVRAQIALTYKDNIATFEFAALNYYNTFKNRYAYKLEGFSDNWIQLGTERRATFTNLDAGEYVLRVKGTNNDGVWNEQGASLHLIVTPPWWKTRWAYVSYGLFAIGFLYRVRQFEIKRREQKARVRESELRTKAVEAEKRALVAENKRKTEELEGARKLQLSMLPRDVPKLPHLEIAVSMKTATEVGGDYYDFSTGEDGTLNVAVGDATGHGMAAGTIVTLMKGFFTSDASRVDMQTFFNHCSKAIREIKLGRLLMAFSLVKITGNKVSLSSAGMPPVYLYRKSTGAIEEIMLKGMPLGAMKNFPYAVHDTQLQTGDTMLLLTDGLPEQKNTGGEMFDYARVQAKLKEVAERTPDEIIQHLVKAGEEWMNGATQDDDVTVLVIKMKGLQ